MVAFRRSASPAPQNWPFTMTMVPMPSPINMLDSRNTTGNAVPTAASAVLPTKRPTYDAAPPYCKAAGTCCPPAAAARKQDQSGGAALRHIRHIAFYRFASISQLLQIVRRFPDRRNNSASSKKQGWRGCASGKQRPLAGRHPQNNSSGTAMEAPFNVALVLQAQGVAVVFHMAAHKRSGGRNLWRGYAARPCRFRPAHAARGRRPLPRGKARLWREWGA